MLKNARFVKLDKRYKKYPRWRYALFFNVNLILSGRKEFRRMSNLFRKLHGPAITEISHSNKNALWEIDVFKCKIYFNEESDITAALLLDTGD